MNSNNYYYCLTNNGMNYYYKKDELIFFNVNSTNNIDQTQLQPNITYNCFISPLKPQSKIKYIKNNSNNLNNDIFDCSVCLDSTIRKKIIYNCGHFMCSKCDSTYFSSSVISKKIFRCHLCRVEITSVSK
jgi:hypothetical protein